MLFHQGFFKFERLYKHLEDNLACCNIQYAGHLVVIGLYILHGSVGIESDVTGLCHVLLCTGCIRQQHNRKKNCKLLHVVFFNLTNR